MKATRLVATLSILMLAAVAATPIPTQAIAIADAEEPAMQLFVNNENALDVEVYLESAQGQRRFLGVDFEIRPVFKINFRQRPGGVPPTRKFHHWMRGMAKIEHVGRLRAANVEELRCQVGIDKLERAIIKQGHVIDLRCLGYAKDELHVKRRGGRREANGVVANTQFERG